MAPPSGSGFFADRYGVTADAALPPRSRCRSALATATIVTQFRGTLQQQREGVAVSDLRGRAKTSVETTAETTANDAVMIDECERFVRDDGFELIFGRAGADDVRRSRLGRNVIDPVSAQRVIVDRELPRRCLDRCAGRQKPFNPHALEVIASLTAPCPGTLPSRHWLSPRPRLIKKTRAPCQHKNLFLEDFTSTAQNYGAVMAVSDLGVYLSEYG